MLVTHSGREWSHKKKDSFWAKRYWKIDKFFILRLILNNINPPKISSFYYSFNPLESGLKNGRNGGNKKFMHFESEL